MQTQTLGQTDLAVTRLAYGCMRYLNTWSPKDVTPEKEGQAHAAIAAALDAGYTLFDHADIYCAGECERVFGQYLDANPDVRDRIVIATKCGIRFGGDPNPDSPHRFDFTAEHILTSCEKSLKRLKTDRIDVYQLHRPDALMDPHEVAGAFDKLKRAGKVLHFGVSNFRPSQVSALAAHCPLPLEVNQVEVHLGDLHTLHDGTLDQCLERTITPLSWSPVGGGFLAEGGAVPEKHENREAMAELLPLLDATAADHGVSRTVVSIAWLLKHPTKIVPIVGSSNPKHIAEATKADGVELSREEWYRLYVAARGEKLP